MISEVNENNNRKTRRVITTRIVDFPDIERQWRNLEADGDVPTIFQTYDWIECWWKHLGFRGKKLIVAAYDGEELVGIAPMYTNRMRIRGIPAFKMLLPMGAGESDYNGFILKKGVEYESLVALLTFLKSMPWDIARIGDVHAEHPMVQYFVDACKKAGLICIEQKHTPCPYITLPEKEDEYLSTLASHFKKNLRTRRRRLDELGNVRFTVAPAEVPVPEAMEEFFRLHESRWNAEGRKGALAAEALKRLHIEAAQRLERYLYTAFLELNGKKIACQYGYTYNSVRYSYLRGWDPEYKKHGVANILLVNLIEEAIKKGIREYDFMRGDEEYKYEFTDRERASILFSVSKKTVVLKIYFIIENASGKNAQGC